MYTGRDFLTITFSTCRWCGKQCRSVPQHLASCEKRPKARRD